jgi:hypothetical protein
MSNLIQFEEAEASSEKVVLSITQYNYLQRLKFNV